MLNFDFNPMGFIDTLPYMGKGMLGIFVVMVIIYILTYALQKLSK